MTPRRLAVFDLDGTLTRADTFGPFVAGLLVRHPWRILRVPLLLAPLLGFALRITDRGGLKGAVLRLLFGGLARAPLAAWAATYARQVVATRMFPAAVTTLNAHRADGDQVVLLSASPDLYVPLIGAELAVDQTICTTIRWNGDRLDGRIHGVNRRDAEKLRVLQQLRQRHPGLPVIAYGNSAPDLVHMAHCEEAVYANADARLARKLTSRGIRCVQWQ